MAADGPCPVLTRREIEVASRRGRYPVPPGIHLTARELQVLELAARGQHNYQIAAALCLSINTIKGHLKSAMQTLGTDNRTRAVVVAMQLGFLPLDCGENHPIGCNT